MTNTYTDRAGRDVESITIVLDDDETIHFDRAALDAGAEVDPGDHWVFVTYADGMHVAYPVRRVHFISMTIPPRQNIGEALLAAERLNLDPNGVVARPHDTKNCPACSQLDPHTT